MSEEVREELIFLIFSRATVPRYQGRIDPARLVFIDETWTKTNMAPLFGWAPRGQRLAAMVPHRPLPRRSAA